MREEQGQDTQTTEVTSTREETMASEEVFLKYTMIKLERYRGNFSKGKMLNSA